MFSAVLLDSLDPLQTGFLIYFALAHYMAALALNVRYFFHSFALHAAIFPRRSRARAVRMSALLHFLSFHWSLPHRDSPSATSKNGPMFSELLFLGIPTRSQHTRIPSPRLFKIAHSPTFAVPSFQPDANRRSSNSSPRRDGNCFKLHRISSLALLKFPCVMS